MGVRAVQVASDNREDRDAVEATLRADAVDILPISPERLANDRFVAEILAEIAGRISLLVVDEAHCISDWGRDFRPDYRRIEGIVRNLPATLRLLATRAIGSTCAVLPCGEEDEHITDYFIASAFPTREEVRDVIDALENAPEGLSVPELRAAVNGAHGKIDKTIRLLSLESPAPIARQGSRWQLTAAEPSGEFRERAERLTHLRRREQRQLVDRTA